MTIREMCWYACSLLFASLVFYLANPDRSLVLGLCELLTFTCAVFMFGYANACATHDFPVEDKREPSES